MRRDLPSPIALRSFEAAARHLSFTLAAEELFVTQSAVSHQVRALESDLGVKLFVRLTRELRLTPSGEALLGAVRDAFDGIESVVKSLKMDSGAGPLKVGATSYFASRWLTRRLGQFSASHPAIEIHLQLTNTDPDFKRSDAEVAIAWGLAGWPDMDCVPLMPLDLIVVCSPTLLGKGDRLERLSDLHRFTLLHESGRGLWQAFFEAVGETDIAAPRSVVIDDPNVLHQACIDGQGIALGAESLLADELEHGLLVRPFDAVVRYGSYFVVSQESALRRGSVRAFREWLVAQAVDD